MMSKNATTGAQKVSWKAFRPVQEKPIRMPAKPIKSAWVSHLTMKEMPTENAVPAMHDVEWKAPSSIWVQENAVMLLTLHFVILLLIHTFQTKRVPLFSLFHAALFAYSPVSTTSMTCPYTHGTSSLFTHLAVAKTLQVGFSHRPRWTTTACCQLAWLVLHCRYRHGNRWFASLYRYGFTTGLGWWRRTWIMPWTRLGGEMFVVFVIERGRRETSSREIVRKTTSLDGHRSFSNAGSGR